jgi:hypothetical protein
MEAIAAQRSLEAASSRRTLATALRVTVAGLIALGALIAGVGALYLMRGISLLAIGPDVRGALPLQQLAGGEAQPLFRMVLAWVPAGFVAGLAFAALTGLSPFARTASLAALLLAGAAADAIAITDPLGPHLLPQLARVGTWTAVALFAVGSLFACRAE